MTHDYYEFVREQVREEVNAYCRRTRRSHSFAYRTLYLKLEDRTGFRVPEGAASGLRVIEASGYIEELYDLAKMLN